MNLGTEFRAQVAIGETHAMAARGDFVGALKVISTGFQLYGVEPPAASVPILFNVLYADLCEKTGKGEAAYYSCDIALRQIYGEAMIDKKWSENDKNYIAYRCLWIIARVVDMEVFSTFLKSWNLKLRSYHIDIGATNSQLRKLFPVREDDAKSLDRYMDRASGG